MQLASPRRPLIAGKLTPPHAPAGVVERRRVVEQFDHGARVLAVVAPPGYGKSEAARQWHARSTIPTAWVALDLLDGDPASFWRYVIAGLRRVRPDLDAEPELLLEERGPGDPLFLSALIAQLELSDRPSAIVLDDLGRLGDRSVFDGIALMVDRVGHLLRFVLISRSDPDLPTARWRASGWLGELREEHLRLRDDEALQVARTFTGLTISDDAVRALNSRVEGWHVGLHLALLSLLGVADPESAATRVAGSDRLLADYLVAEVVDQLSPAERNVALTLSVLDWFDAELCAELVGADAGQVIQQLHRRRLFLTKLDDGVGGMRFHPLFRELLESELRWRDPARRLALHRRAAASWRRRGDVNSAYRHLVKVGDVDAACELVVPLALEFVDRGDINGLVQRMRSLPSPMRVERPSQAFDLSIAWFFAGDGAEAARWCDRAEQLITPDDRAERLRLHSTRGLLALMGGDLDGALGHEAGYVRYREHVDEANPIDARFATIGARVALATRRHGSAAAWLAVMEKTGGPDAVACVILPALRAQLELDVGDLRRATTLADGAGEHATRLRMRPHQGALDALLVAAHCRLAAGDLDGASQDAEQAHLDAAVLDWRWNRVRVEALRAELRRIRRGPHAGLEMVTGLRSSLREPRGSRMSRSLDVVEVLSLLGAGRYDAARSLIDVIADVPTSQLLRARLAVATGEDEALDDLLTDRSSWTTAERIEADLLVAAASPHADLAVDRGTALLRSARSAGWVAPFLGHGDRVSRLLRKLPTESLHPDLDRVLRRSGPPSATAARSSVEQLTAREMTVLELLPTHLSYAQIGQCLYLSVNTIKTNLKSLYRKLAVASRSEAVDVGRTLGLIDRPAHG